MRRRNTRIAALVSALAAGTLAAFTLRPQPSGTATLAARTPAVEVRTVVIRRTVHVKRKVPGAGHAAGKGPGNARAAGPGRSGARGSATAVATRTSPSHGSTGGSSGSGSPVTTRTSSGASSGSGSSGGPVTSRSSGGGGGSDSEGGDRGEHDGGDD